MTPDNKRAAEKISVHILIPPEPDAHSALSEMLLPEVSLTSGSILPSSPEYDILVAGLPDRLHLEASPKLHTLVIPFTGFPANTRTLMKEFPHIAIHNLHHNASDTAEMTIGLLLAAAKFIIPFDQSFRKHDWSFRYRESPSISLRDKRALILGFGKIGQEVGKFCHALGIKLMAIRRHPQRLLTLPFHVEIFSLAALKDLLPDTDILIICMPLTSETEGLLGEGELALLPPGGILVNVGRGRIVDQAALYQALVERHLAAAGLDVWYNYPLVPEERVHTPPSDYPFHELDNVVMSPHRAGLTKETEVKRMRSLAALLNAAALGNPLPNRIDRSSAY